MLISEVEQLHTQLLSVDSPSPRRRAVSVATIRAAVQTSDGVTTVAHALRLCMAKYVPKPSRRILREAPSGEHSVSNSTTSCAPAYEIEGKRVAFVGQENDPRDLVR